jgi:hypothetical protein
MRSIFPVALLLGLALSATAADGPTAGDRYLLDLGGDGADANLQPGTDDGWLAVEGTWTSSPTRTRQTTSRFFSTSTAFRYVEGDLATYDGNVDGRINAADPAWAALRVHVDVDADGRVDPGERIGLGDAGVASIDVSGYSFQRSNGTTGEVLRVP